MVQFLFADTPFKSIPINWFHLSLDIIKKYGKMFFIAHMLQNITYISIVLILSNNYE